jgi:hypothetical protein
MPMVENDFLFHIALTSRGGFITFTLSRTVFSDT